MTDEKTKKPRGPRKTVTDTLKAMHASTERNLKALRVRQAKLSMELDMLGEREIELQAERDRLVTALKQD